jgi:CRP-like cAMP-binding protein
MEKFLRLLSPALKSQILFHMYKGIVRKIEIFDSFSDIELRYIVVNMKTVIFLPLDEIIRQGDSGDSIYFLSRGSCDVFMKSDEQMFKEIEAGKESKEKAREIG